MADLSPYVKNVAVGASAFLLADRVTKSLPASPLWALGWGTVAFGISYAMVKQASDPAAKAVGLGVAAAYLHGFAHQTSYPHKKLGPKT